jgi:glycosyltransferase involved in cell wall biosynthesis
MMVYPSALHRHAELRRMRHFLSTAAAIVMSTPEAVKQVKRYFPELADRPIVAIPNGFDAADFAEVRDGREPDGKFRIVHTGYLHTSLGYKHRRSKALRWLIGGPQRGVDLLTRSHLYLLQAIGRLVEDDPSLASRVELQLAGVLSREDREVAAGFDAVRLLGYVSHHQAVELMRGADLLFLPMQKLPPGRRSSTIPGKTYEYVASGRPILAAVPEGDVRDVLAATQDVSICEPDDVDGMVKILRQRLQAPLQAPSKPSLDGQVMKYEYENLAGRVAEVTSEVLARRTMVALDGPRTVLRPAATNRARSDGARKAARKRLLWIAYYFPPIGGAGAQRSLKFVRYLPELGYDITVITGPGTSGDRWTPADETLGREISPETEIHRVAGPEPSGSDAWRRRAERWLRLPRRWDRWWIEGVVEAAQGVGHIDLIYASMSPYPTAEAAVRLARKLGKPWVADLRDPWVLDEMMVYPSNLHRAIELRHMRRLLRTADTMVLTAPEAARRLRATFPELAGKPVAAIPNGFDADDFDVPPERRTYDKFSIVHTGYLHTTLGRQQHRSTPVRRLLGGQTEGADILTRSHVFLLQAIEQLIERDPELASTIEVQLAGVLSADDESIGRESGVAVRMLGYLPHAETIALMRSANMLFLPMQNLPPGVRSSTVPGKTYEYLAAGRPILAAIPEGDARDIVGNAGTGHICNPDDVDAMVEAIAREVERWREGKECPTPPPGYLARFERRHLTAELAAMLANIIGPSEGFEVDLSLTRAAPGQERLLCKTPA